METTKFIGKHTQITGYSRRYVEMKENEYHAAHKYGGLIEIEGKTAEVLTVGVQPRAVVTKISNKPIKPKKPTESSPRKGSEERSLGCFNFPAYEYLRANCDAIVSLPYTNGYVCQDRDGHLVITSELPYLDTAYPGVWMTTGEHTRVAPVSKITGKLVPNCLFASAFITLSRLHKHFFRVPQTIRDGVTNGHT